MGKYEGVVAAAMQGENALWELGDEIIKAIGERAPEDYKPGSRDGSREKLKEIAAELVTVGIELYDEKSLAEARVVASTFKGSDRIKNVSFTAHKRAGSPHILRAAMVYAEETGKRLSTRLIDDFKKRLAAEEKESRKEAHKDAIEARKEAEKEAALAKEEKRKANDPNSREDAARREHEAKERAKEAELLARQLKGPPSKSELAKKASRKEDVSIIVVKTDLSAAIAKAQALVKQMDKNVTPHVDDLSPAFVTNAVEELLAVAEAFRQLAYKVQGGQVNKRSHIHRVA